MNKSELRINLKMYRQTKLVLVAFVLLLLSLYEFVVLIFNKAVRLEISLSAG